MIQHVARRWGDASDETNEAFGGPLVEDFSHAMRMSLAPGPALDEQNKRMAERALLDIDTLVSSSGSKTDGSKIMLLDWARHVVTQASSCGVYGNEHPFLDPEVEQAFWYVYWPFCFNLVTSADDRAHRAWHSHLSAHISGLDFDIFGRGYAARQKVFDAHAKYCSDIPSDTSLLFTERWRVLLEAGISEADSIKQQATLPIGMLSNTVPTFHWTIWELYSREDLLAEVRAELKAHAIIEQEDGFALNIAALKTDCSLLLSVFQETQRIRHIHAAIRKVMSDTLLDGKYLLRKGNYLQMPGSSIHSNTELWGPSATDFDPYRFVNQGAHASGVKKRGRDFLAWGAPPHLCPARQFAATEILILVALLVMRVDLRPVRGTWEKSPALDFNDPVTVLNPKTDVQVNVNVREKWAGDWKLHMSPSTCRVPLASG